MNIKTKIESLLGRTLNELSITNTGIQIVRNSERKHGEYSSNIALSLSKELEANPLELAQQIASVFKKRHEIDAFIDKVEIAAPGFINFFVKQDALLEEIVDNLQKFHVSEKLKKKVIVVEYTDPNPFKELHIGHLFSNIVGESIARLLEAQSADIKRVCYQGDVGLHVAKSVWGMLELFNQNISLDNLKKYSLTEKAKFLGEAYTKGSFAYEKDPQAKDEIIDLNKRIYQKDSSILEVYIQGRQWSLDYFETIYRRLGTKFDHYYFESEVEKNGVEYVRHHIKDGVFEESDGAIVFKGEQFGLHTRVFINSLGLPTYEAKELGLAPMKYKDYHYDRSIVVTGNEINEYFKVVMAVLKRVDEKLYKRTTHLSHGMLRLSEGKMSSRKGNIITAEALLDTAVNQAKEISEMDEQTAKIVGEGAVKYMLLRNSIGKDITFNFHEAVSFEGNSGPYLQYTFVRAKRILEKANFNFIEFSSWPEGENKNKFEDNKNWLDEMKGLLSNLKEEEKNLSRQLSFFSDIVIEAGDQFAPHVLCTYLFQLAQIFNKFYETLPVLKGNLQEMRLRVFLVYATSETMKKGLSILGMKVPESM